MKCSSGVKTVGNSKMEVGIENLKKLERVRLKEDVPGVIFLQEKPEECKSVCYRSSTSN